MNKPQPQQIYMLGDIINYVETNLEIDDETLSAFKEIMTNYDLMLYGLDFAWKRAYHWKDFDLNAIEPIIFFLKEEDLYNITILINPL